MATPIVEQIAVKVRNRLLQITTGNGYETTVHSVIRPTRIDETSPVNNQLWVTQEDIAKNEALSTHGNPPTQGWEVTFRIAGILQPSESVLTAADTLRNAFWGDVVGAITTPTTGDWAQWDGLAYNSMISSVEPYTANDGESSGFSVMLTVMFQTPENDPFTVR